MQHSAGVHVRVHGLHGVRSNVGLDLSAVATNRFSLSQHRFLTLPSEHELVIFSTPSLTVMGYIPRTEPVAYAALEGRVLV